MKTKQSIIAVVTVIMAMAAITGCKKEETPVKTTIHKNVELAVMRDSTENLSGGHDHPVPPPH